MHNGTRERIGNRGPAFFSRTAATAVICLVFLAAAPTAAFAYIDPGTGSYLLQILLAGVLGSAVAIRIFWKRIKTFFARVFGRKPEKDASSGS